MDIRAQAGMRVQEILSTHYPENIHPDIDAKVRERFDIKLDRSVMEPGNGRW